MARSPWENAPANSREGQLGRLVRSVTVSTDELSAPTVTDADTVRSQRGEHGHWGPGNTGGKDKRVKAGPRGALATLEAAGDPAWVAAVRWGRRYGAHRRRELAAAHGALSAGVGTIVESAADLMADARYWRAKAIASGDPDLSRLAAQLTAQARGCERDAWQLAALEATARRESNPEAANAGVIATFSRKGDANGS